MCSTEHATPAPVAGADAYWLCPHCGGLSLVTPPARQHNSLFEGAERARLQRDLEEARQEYFLRHLVRVEKHMTEAVQDWRLMEIGCGSGVLLRIAAERGWRADALELSPALATLAACGNPHANISVSDVSEYTHGAADYHAVIALDVLEHVLDPELMLRNCGAMLKPGGLLLLQTPNTMGLRARLQGEAWEMRDPAQHLNLCSPKGLRLLLEATGFKVVELHTVSGTGLELGVAKWLAHGKQFVLDRFRLGNALCVLARRSR